MVSVGTVESGHSSILSAKAAKIKQKIKRKLHRDGVDGNGEEDEYFDEDDDADDMAEGTEAVTPGGTKTAAQMYAEKHQLENGNGSVIAGSRVVDGNGQITGTTMTFKQPDGSLRTATSTPATPQSPATPAKTASIRSHSGSTSLPATQSNWQRRAGRLPEHFVRIAG